MNLERYWKTFSSDLNDVSGATVLEDCDLPILEVNAGYPKSTGQILEIKRRYVSRGRPACLILPEGSSLELEASNAQFVPCCSFAILEHELDPERDWTETPIIEQVGWGAARVIAQTWCESVGARGWEVSVSSEIARVMPNDPNIFAYVALENDCVIGMGFALDGAVHWLAGTTEVKTAIVQRAAFDSGNTVQFSVILEQIQHFRQARELERYVIWTESNVA